MGFNKRYLSEENLRYQFEDGGSSAVFEYLFKPDALIGTDDFSGECMALIHSRDSKEQIIQRIETLFLTTAKGKYKHPNITNK